MAADGCHRVAGAEPPAPGDYRLQVTLVGRRRRTENAAPRRPVSVDAAADLELVAPPEACRAAGASVSSRDHRRTPGLLAARPCVTAGRRSWPMAVDGSDARGSRRGLSRCRVAKPRRGPATRAGDVAQRRTVEQRGSCWCAWCGRVVFTPPRAPTGCRGVLNRIVMARDGRVPHDWDGGGRCRTELHQPSDEDLRIVGYLEGNAARLLATARRPQDRLIRSSCRPHRSVWVTPSLRKAQLHTQNVSSSI